VEIGGFLPIPLPPSQPVLLMGRGDDVTKPEC
jgi:hypothetical protein